MIKRIFKIKSCISCSKTYTPTSSKQMYCIDCGKLNRIKKHKLSSSIWHKKNNYKYKEYREKWNSENTHHLKNYRSKYYKDNEKRKEYYKNYIILKNEKIKKYKRDYYRKRISDIDFKIKQTLRSRLGHALRNRNILKSKRTMELIGCDIKNLIEHIELNFKPGMSWDNHGQWHIDHIKPCSMFNLKLEEEQKKCFNYKNLQPLWAKENLRKGTKEAN